jgi:HAE1 family hydrophobic/amphiphilic exporter-1
MQLVDFAIRRRVTIAMATVAVALLGGISLSRLKVNLLPDLSYPTLTIRTELPGAAPLEVENLISRPIEEAAGVVRNVRTVRSISRSGQSDVVIEFLWGTEMDFAGIEVRERLDLLQLPLEATRPLLLRFDPSTQPVVRLALVDTAAEAGVERLKFLRRFADDRLKPEIESIEGSAAVKVSGGFEDEVHVYVDQERLAQLDLSIQLVAQRIGAENVNLSGGRLEQGTQRFLVRRAAGPRGRCRPRCTRYRCRSRCRSGTPIRARPRWCPTRAPERRSPPSSRSAIGERTPGRIECRGRSRGARYRPGPST